MAKDGTKLVWLDMEMTGLDPQKEGIIEIATIITDSKLNILEEGPSLVIHQSQALLQEMDPWNTKHHEKSGLLEKVRKSKITVKQAEKLTLEFIKKYCAPKKALLCGNSVHHDRRFLERDMPEIHEYLHYRHIDVSTVKSLAKFWYPKVKFPKKDNAHRALDDIRESIEELKYYRARFFKSRVKSKGV